MGWGAGVATLPIACGLGALPPLVEDAPELSPLLRLQLPVHLVEHHRTATDDYRPVCLDLLNLLLVGLVGNDGRSRHLVEDCTLLVVLVDGDLQLSGLLA